MKGTYIEAAKPDPAQTAYFNYMLQNQQKKDAAAIAAADEEKNKIKAVTSTGLQGYATFKQNLENQVKAGIINYGQAKDSLKDYEDRYNLGVGYSLADQNAFIKAATDTQSSKLKTLAGQTYQDVLGEAATEEDLSKFETLYKTGEYKLSDLVNTIKASDKYREKFNRSYLSAYNDEMYGKEETITDAKTGKTTRTGRRTFNYDVDSDPLLAGFSVAPGTSKASTSANPPGSPSVAAISNAKKPGFTGTIEEIQEYQQALRQNRQFKIDSGLLSLQGQIDKETQKIKNQGVQDTARITGNAQMLANLTQGFWS